MDIYTLNGQLKETISITDKSTVELDISTYTKGIYIITLQWSNGENSSVNFIKD